jgi:hypothetical protein
LRLPGHLSINTALSEIQRPSTPSVNRNAGDKFDIDREVTRLFCMAANARSERGRQYRESFGSQPFALVTIDELPDPSRAFDAAQLELKAFADELAAGGGLERMALVYDEAVERHGYRALGGVSAAWNGRHGWWH